MQIILLHLLHFMLRVWDIPIWFSFTLQSMQFEAAGGGPSEKLEESELQLDIRFLIKYIRYARIITW